MLLIPFHYHYSGHQGNWDVFLLLKLCLVSFTSLESDNQLVQMGISDVKIHGKLHGKCITMNEDLEC